MPKETIAFALAKTTGLHANGLLLPVILIIQISYLLMQKNRTVRQAHCRPCRIHDIFAIDNVALRQAQGDTAVLCNRELL